MRFKQFQRGTHGLRKRRPREKTVECNDHLLRREEARTDRGEVSILFDLGNVAKRIIIRVLRHPRQDGHKGIGLKIDSIHFCWEYCLMVRISDDECRRG